MRSMRWSVAGLVGRLGLRCAAVTGVLTLAAACGGQPTTQSTTAEHNAAPSATAVSPATLKPGQSVPTPSGKPVFTMTGKITATNQNGRLALDLPTVERLAMHPVRRYEPWTKQNTEFRGVWRPDPHRLPERREGGSERRPMDLEHQGNRRPVMLGWVRRSVRKVFAGRRGAPEELVPDLVAAPVGRWQRVVQVVLVFAMVSATAGVLGIVVHNSVLLGRMTTDVSTAQERTTNLHNLQREMLRLLQELTEFEPGGDLDAVTIRRGLVGRMVTVVQLLFPASSPQARELAGIQVDLQSFAWSRLGHAGTEQAARTAAKSLVSGFEIRIKNLYDEQEKFFYGA